MPADWPVVGSSALQGLREVGKREVIDGVVAFLCRAARRCGARARRRVSHRARAGAFTRRPSHQGDPGALTRQSRRWFPVSATSAALSR
jgi:hypothetical protein